MKDLILFFGFYEENKIFIGKDFIVIFVCCIVVIGVGVSFGVGGLS